MGLLSGEIKDWQLAASSVVSRAHDPNCAVKYARLHAPGQQAWCPEHVKQGEWILVDLGVESEISGVMTQVRLMCFYRDYMERFEDIFYFP